MLRSGTARRAGVACAPGRVGVHSLIVGAGATRRRTPAAAVAAATSSADEDDNPQSIPAGGSDEPPGTDGPPVTPLSGIAAFASDFRRIVRAEKRKVVDDAAAKAATPPALLPAAGSELTGAERLRAFRAAGVGAGGARSLARAAAAPPPAPKPAAAARRPVDTQQQLRADSLGGTTCSPAGSLVPWRTRVSASAPPEDGEQRGAWRLRLTLAAAAQDAALARSLLCDMSEAGCPPGPVEYHAGVAACALSGELLDALALVQDQHARGGRALFETYKVLIRCLAVVGAVPEAKLSQEGATKPLRFVAPSPTHTHSPTPFAPRQPPRRLGTATLTGGACW